MSTDATETAAGAATPTPSTLSSAKESTASPPAAAPAAATATTEATDASPVPATAPAEGGDSTKKESTGGDDADAAALAAATKKLQLNPDVPEFTPVSQVVAPMLYCCCRGVGFLCASPPSPDGWWQHRPQLRFGEACEVVMRGTCPAALSVRYTLLAVDLISL